jgi:hypothetical protein
MNFLTRAFGIFEVVSKTLRHFVRTKFYGWL